MASKEFTFQQEPMAIAIRDSEWLMEEHAVQVGEKLVIPAA